MKIAYWVFLLILIYLLIAYYKGTQAVGQTFSDFITKSILFLQGRDATGKVSGYPK